MLYKIRKFINTIIDKIGIVIFLIVGIGIIFGGVMLWTVEKSMATVIPIVFGLAILTVPLGRLVKILFNKDFSFGTKHLVYSCFILMFLFFAGLLLWVMGNTVAAMINGETTTAQIDGMSSNGVPYVKYYVDGESYRVYLGSSSPGMYVGKEISVAYYPENPERLYHCGMSAFVLPGIGLLVMVAGLVFVIYLWISPIIKTVEKKTFEINSKTIWGVG